MYIKVIWCKLFETQQGRQDYNYMYFVVSAKILIHPYPYLDYAEVLSLSHGVGMGLIMTPSDSLAMYNQTRYLSGQSTMCPMKSSHGFVLLCFIVVKSSSFADACDLFIYIFQGYSVSLALHGAIINQCQNGVKG